MKNKASDIKLVSVYSTIKMMHGPINTRQYEYNVISRRVRTATVAVERQYLLHILSVCL